MSYANDHLRPTTTELLSNLIEKYLLVMFLLLVPISGLSGLLQFQGNSLGNDLLASLPILIGILGLIFTYLITLVFSNKLLPIDTIQKSRMYSKLLFASIGITTLILSIMHIHMSPHFETYFITTIFVYSFYTGFLAGSLYGESLKYPLYASILSVLSSLGVGFIVIQIPPIV